MSLITATVAKGATPDELKLFLYRAQNLGLDPLKPGQIHFIKYGTGPGTIVVGIDGFRAKASRTGKLAGIKRGAIHDEKGTLIGGWAEVFRTDWKEPAREEAPLKEYNTGKSQWAKMPETMIKKVAEVAALRMAFLDDLGGIYIPEEMEQAATRQVDPTRSEAPKAVSENEAIKVIAEFSAICQKAGPNFFKTFLTNSKGESPTYEQVTKWRSHKQIEWLKSAVQQMQIELAQDSDELPEFDAEFENA